MSILVKFYRFMWWNIMMRFCDLGSRLMGDRWLRLYGCRVHGGIVNWFGDVPESWWELFGWKKPS